MIAPPRPPSHDDAEALIKEARARQLRRRLRGTAGVAIAAAIGLGIYAVSGGSSPGNFGAGPANAGSATGPRCRASQLSATVGFQGATQMAVGGASIKNVSGSSCSLPASWPRVRIWSGSRRLPVVQRRPAGDRHFVERPARVLVPGGVATLEMQWGNWCGSHALTNERFVIELGPALIVSAPAVAAPRCLARGHTSTLIVDRPVGAS